MGMSTETRWAVEGPGPRECHNTKTAADRAAAKRSRDEGLDAGSYTVRPVNVLVGAFNVVSTRDGETVVSRVDHATAEREARRLTEQASGYRAEQPVSTELLVTGAALAPTLYTVEAVGDLELADRPQEA